MEGSGGLTDGIDRHMKTNVPGISSPVHSVSPKPLLKSRLRCQLALDGEKMLSAARTSCVSYCSVGLFVAVGGALHEQHIF